MVGQEKIYMKKIDGWFDTQKKIDGWLDGWMDKKQMDGWMNG